MSTDFDSATENDENPEEKAAAFLRDYCEAELSELCTKYPREKHSLLLDYADLFAFDPGLADDFIDEPEEVRGWFEGALYKISLPIDIDLDNPGVNVRVYNLSEDDRVDVGFASVNKVKNRLVALRGQVAKRSEGSSKVTALPYECARCGGVTTVPQTSIGLGAEDSLQDPSECIGCERQGPFVLKREKIDDEDYQLVRLQPLPEKGITSQDDIDIILRDDLVGSLEAGDRVIINSHIRLYQQQKNSSVFGVYGEGESIEHLDITHDDVDVGPYKDEIEAIAAGEYGDPYEVLVNSFAPSHFGDDRVKEAIIYQLFGASDKDIPDGSTRRGTIHVALVGDPGCGKSTFLKRACELAPSSVFVTGKGASSAGLTVAAVQDDFGGGGWTLEAGALVQAHGGLAAVDELDKMRPEDQSGMLECMSDQTISVAKAGMSATLPANTTILSAANPSDGRFTDQYRIGEELGIEPVLRSRFDLIFPLTDEPDAERDRSVADRMTAAMKAGQEAARGQSSDFVDDMTPEVSDETLRAYIAHAQSLTPVITEEARQQIISQYADFRQANEEGGAVSSTARVVEALFRLAEASARIRLGDTITTNDVERATRLQRACLIRLGLDPDSGDIDIDIMETGIPKSQRDRIHLLEDIVNEVDRDTDTAGAPLEDILDIAEDRGIKRRQAESDLSNLKERGELYAPGTDQLKVS